MRKSEGGALPRSFVHFILEPFYKLVSCTISNEKAELAPIVKKLGILLQKKDYNLDIKPLIKLVLTKFFGRGVNCMVDAMVESVRNSQEGTRTKVMNYFRNSNDDQGKSDELSKCDAKSTLAINVVKLIYNENTGNFYSFGRIISGTVRRGD
jgi:U5 small nuclear ribonucleoprotein component